MPRQKWLAAVALFDDCRSRLLDSGEIELHLQTEQARFLLDTRELPDMAAIVILHLIETTPIAPAIRAELSLIAAIVESYTGVEAASDPAPGA
jgi:hypothetical protein